MSDLEIVAVAVRLLSVTVIVLILPGFLLLKALRVAPEWPERIVFAFSLSYCWMFVLSIVLPVLRWTADYAAVLTLLLVLGAAVVAFRGRAQMSGIQRTRMTRTGAVVIVAAVVAFGAAGWIVEPPVTGEEALDLASLSRFADGGPITFENTSLLPDTRPVYVFQPYQLALGIIARWSDVDPAVTLVKFRSFLAPLTLLFVFAFLRRLVTAPAEAVAAFAVVLLFVGLDTGTWEWNSLFPFVRRGGIGAALCAPALMVLTLAATRAAADPGSRSVGRVALFTAPLMLLASLSTHPLEVFTFLWFAGGLAAVALLGFDRSANRTHTLTLVVLFAAVTATYLSIHARAVPYVAEYERSDKGALREELRVLASSPVTAIAGGPTEARELLTRTLPGTTETVLGIPALLLAILRGPAAAAILATAIVPLALVYASPAGFTIVKLATSPETARDVSAYFGLMGLAAVALGAVALAQVILNAAGWYKKGFAAVAAGSAVGSIALWLAWMATLGGVRWLTARSLIRPEVLLAIGVIVAAVVLIVARTRAAALVRQSPFSTAVLAVTLCLAVPLVAPGWAFGGAFARRTPTTLWERITAARTSPSVLDWPAYYEGQLRHSVYPPTVPIGVLDELRRRIPPRQIVLAHPRYSCALAALIDAYCVNPFSISGHYFQPAAPYFAKYVRQEEGALPQHPFFNGNRDLTDAERRLLREYNIAYVLVPPEDSEQISRKVEGAAPGATLEMEHEGYRLYRISRS